MPTKFVGTKELRQNMAKIAKSALENKEKIIVLRKNKPIFELRPLSDEDSLLESFRIDIEEAQNDKKAGRVKSQVEVEKLLGL